MNVTRSNVAQAEPIFDRMLRECDFFAIDTEFTGMPKGRANPFDSPEERYRSRCLSQKKYMIVQYGICGFRYDVSRKAYIYYPFNFFVFPSTANGLAPEQDFACLPSSLTFLAGCGFDFTKLVNDGVPFIRADVAAACREKLEKSHEHQNARLTREAMGGGDGKTRDGGAGKKENPIPIPEHLTARMSSVKDSMVSFMRDDARDSMVIEDCRNPFLRKLIFQEMELRYEGVVIQTQKQRTGNTSMVVTKGTKADGARIFKEHQGKEFRDLETEIGFTKLILKLAKSRKPVVGHNMIIDIAMTLGQFVEDFPGTLAQFKGDSLNLFPRVYDTKVLSMSEQLQQRIPSSILGDLIKIVSSEVFQLPQMLPAEDMPGYKTDSEETLHEAGFDAFVTGVSFIGMCLALGANNEQMEKVGHPCVDLSSPILVPFQNKLNSMIADIPAFDLEKDEPMPDRSNVFHVSFPPEWKTPDILNLFEPCGRCYVVWIDESSAFVRLEDKRLVSKVAKIAQKFESVKITTYQAFAEAKGRHDNKMDCDEGGTNRKRKLSGSENLSGNGPETNAEG